MDFEARLAYDAGKNGLFMTAKEAKRLGLGASTLPTGKKQVLLIAKQAIFCRTS